MKKKTRKKTCCQFLEQLDSRLDAGLQRTQGGVGMSRQRLPVEKECWCPAELILAGRKEELWKARESGRRRYRGKRRSQGLGRNGKSCLRTNPLPIH